MNPRTTKVLRPAWALLFAAALACSGGESASTGATTAGMTTGTTSTSSATGKTTGATGTTGAASTSSTSTSTTGAVSSTTGDATATETGCSFLCDTGCGASPGLDGVVRCSVECTVWAQDCPEGQKCVPWANDGGSSWNGTKCAPIDPEPKAPGEPCVAPEGGVSGVDDCDGASMCWDVDAETKEGTCVAFCQGTEDEPVCAPGTHCSITSDGVLILCLPMCDPLLQDCPGDDLCIYSSDGFICVLDASGEGGAFGDACEYVNACDAGLVCLNPEYVPDCMGGGCCSPFCDTTAPNTCPGDGQECIPWFEEGEAPEGYESVGFCGIPQ